MSGVRSVARDTFNCDPASIQDGTVADDIPGWDSLSHSIFIMNIEHLFRVEFAPNDVFSFSCIGDLVTALQRLQP